MAGKTQVVFLNDDVTIYCKIPGSPLLDSSIMGVIWFRKIQGSAMEARLFEYYGDHQAAFRPGASVPLELLERGDASLRLPAIQLREAGEYRCEVVVTPQKAEGVVQVEVVGECPSVAPYGFPGAGAQVEQGLEQGPGDQMWV